MIVKTNNYYMFWKSDSKLSKWSFTPMVWEGHNLLGKCWVTVGETL